MADKEGEELSICSEETSSVCDEDRTRKLFQVCDTDGDGFINSQDLEKICHELNLENCIEGLLQELGADEEGKISFDKFFNKKVALRPEINALKKKQSSRETNEYLPSSSNNSLGKHECWEFDSGARDLSPEPSTLQRLIDTAGGSTNTGNLLQLANKLHLAALASLRAEISDLHTRLNAVTEERDILENALKKCRERSENSLMQRYEEQITELHSVIAELNKKLEAKQSCAIVEEDSSDVEQNASEKSVAKEEKSEKTVANESILSTYATDLKKLQLQFDDLNETAAKSDIELRQTKMLLNLAHDQIDKLRNKLRESENRRLVMTNSPEFRRKSNIATQQVRQDNSVPVTKVAERVRLPKMERPVTGTEIANLGVSHTEVAEHLVSKVQEECNLEELYRKDRKHLEIEAERLNSRLEHLKAQNTTLQISLREARENCEKLYSLLGKFESNAVALRLCFDTSEKLNETYEALVNLLTRYKLDMSMSKDEKELRATIASLKKELLTIEPTVVQLESYHTNEYENREKPNNNETKKLDLEMAVLMQDLMEMRENNAELRATTFMLDRERESLELKVAALQSQLQAYLYAHNNDPKMDNDEKDNVLQERLNEVAEMLDKVNKNSESRQKQSLELTNQLRNTNSALLKTLERCKRKSQMKMKKLETEMLTMMEKHALQVKSLKQRIGFLEDLCKDQFSANSKSSQAITGGGGDTAASSSEIKK